MGKMAMKRNNLNVLRTEIDCLDKKLIYLLNQRARIVQQINEVKKNFKLPGFDPTREKKIVEKLQEINKGPLSKQDIEIIMNAIFKVCRSFGRPLKIAYFGPAGTFTHQASLHQFGEKNIYVPCRTIESVFREVGKNRVDYGVVPVENSTEGIVTHTLDMFIDCELIITAEIILEIHHFLLSRETRLDKIKKIYSHAQAFAQCQRWLEDNIKNASLIETESTAYAVDLAKKEAFSAAIGSEVAAELYNMNILASNIEDFKENVTRFLVIGANETKPSGDDKTSIMFSIRDRVGALHDMLVPFKKYSINLTRIESRPTKKKAWEYIFFVDFLGHKDDKNVKTALRMLEKNCVFLKILGSYPRGGS